MARTGAYPFVAMSGGKRRPQGSSPRPYSSTAGPPNESLTIGGTEFTTALFPKDGRYLVPVKVAVQRAEAIGEGAIIEVVLRLNAGRRG